MEGPPTKGNIESHFRTALPSSSFLFLLLLRKWILLLLGPVLQIDIRSLMQTARQSGNIFSSYSFIHGKQNSSYDCTDLSWKDYFRDPSSWHCNDSAHASSGSTRCRDGEEDAPVLVQCQSSEPAGFKNSFPHDIDECNPPWVHEEMRRRIDNVHVKPNLKQEKEYCNVNHNQVVTFMTLLRACASRKDLKEGIKLHNEILRNRSLRMSPYIASSLVSMYAKCGMLTKAQKVLDDLPVRNAVSWSTLIACYAQQDQGHQALKCFDEMQREGLLADAITFTCVLKACSSTRSVDKGKQIHEEIVKRGMLENDVVLGTSLVDMYAKCGMLMKAQEVLEGLPVRNVVSWNALVSGYMQQGRCDEALNCFEQMQSEGLSPNAVTFTSILTACGISGDSNKGMKIHDEILTSGLLKKDIVLGNALIDMYSKCGMLAKAQQVLEKLPSRNVVTWSTLISGFVQYGQDYEAFECFEQMQSEGVSPNAITYIRILKACGNAGAINKGTQIHNEILSKDSLKNDIVLGNALVSMYGKCGMLAKAKQVLKELPIRDTDSWCAMILGYSEHNQPHEALCCYEKMISEGLPADAIMYILVLKACGCTRSIDKGKLIHEEILNRGLVDKDLLLGTALVDMYAKCGLLVEAQQVLEKLPVRDVVSWSALIMGYVEEGQVHEALRCFEKMQNDGLTPDEVAFISILKACSITGAVGKGKQFHDEIISRGLVENDTMLGTALVDMYAKCGLFAKAKTVLKELSVRDVVSWCALIAGYAQQGFSEEALRCFGQMLSEGLPPDDVTFLCVLNACSHSGLLNEAQLLFEKMTTKYGITPNLEHHTAMVMIFACAGHFDKALSVIRVMPSSDFLVVWVVLLGACKKWGNVKLAKLAFDQAFQLDSTCGATYALMANIFAAARMKEDAQHTEIMKGKYTSLGKSHCVYRKQKTLLYT